MVRVKDVELGLSQGPILLDHTKLKIFWQQSRGVRPLLHARRTRIVAEDADKRRRGA